MPGRKFIFGLGQKLPISKNNRKNNYKNKLEINPEDLDPMINEVERVRGMDIVIVTTAKTNEEAYDLLKELGIPFRK